MGRIAEGSHLVCLVFSSRQKRRSFLSIEQSLVLPFSIIFGGGKAQKMRLFVLLLALALVGLGMGADSAPAGAEKVAFEADVKKMLDIIINALYTNRNIFLREVKWMGRGVCGVCVWGVLVCAKQGDGGAAGAGVGVYLLGPG